MVSEDGTRTLFCTSMLQCGTHNLDHIRKEEIPLGEILIYLGLHRALLRITEPVQSTFVVWEGANPDCLRGVNETNNEKAAQKSLGRTKRNDKARTLSLWNGAIALEVWNIFWVVNEETIPDNMIDRRDYLINKREDDEAWEVLKSLVKKETAEMKEVNDRFLREACQHQGGHAVS
jgi:hypothetical protein